ncbi:carboxylesterase [Desulfopila sp. IMCC35008]|uniref:alpha/beta hydrolase n=1 Tax=Desulfopila sp. IMCC35008 TaxID=2653858 RepID=UPI0013D7439E|nr:alpha/beta fold hydrolase [Desulfopila sp. IMCC35008]
MKKLFVILFYMLSGFCIVTLCLLIFRETKRPDLELWHTEMLDADFSAGRKERIKNLDEYRLSEKELFSQLSSRITSKYPKQEHTYLNRYSSGSWSDPQTFSKNWNTTFELTTQQPRAAVLMLHGLSDSPYSLRALALKLHREQVYVLGLRLPGHGTAPGGLVHVEMEDFTASVRLAMQSLKKEINKDVPLYIIGYSNGAALALEYTLSALEGENVPVPSGLVLISPAISVSPLAVLAKWKQLLSRIPGLEQLAWLSVEPEYDPYKYNSFAVNAGVQIYRLTRKIANQISRLDTGEGIENFPKTLAFISAADSTIPPKSLADDLMLHLAPNNHKMVLFDINREADTGFFLTNDPSAQFAHLETRPLPFNFSLITNVSPQTRALVSRNRAQMSMTTQTVPIPYHWPRDIYALSHVSLPFPSDDPVYGIPDENDSNSFTLGKLEPRGEKNLLKTPIENLMRLRYNPFYDHLEEQTVNWVLAN